MVSAVRRTGDRNGERECVLMGLVRGHCLVEAERMSWLSSVTPCIHLHCPRRPSRRSDRFVPHCTSNSLLQKGTDGSSYTARTRLMSTCWPPCYIVTSSSGFKGASLGCLRGAGSVAKGTPTLMKTCQDVTAHPSAPRSSNCIAQVALCNLQA